MLLDPVAGELDPGTTGAPLDGRASDEPDGLGELPVVDGLDERVPTDGAEDPYEPGELGGGEVRMVGSGAARRVVGEDSDDVELGGLAADEMDGVAVPGGAGGNDSGRGVLDPVLAESV
jgi:hypothetical protein